jgi:phage antirepressor YoqD-like protein
MIATFFYIFFLLFFIWMINHHVGYKQKFLKKNPQTQSDRDSGFFGVNFGTAALKKKKKLNIFKNPLESTQKRGFFGK